MRYLERFLSHWWLVKIDMQDVMWKTAKGVIAVSWFPTLQGRSERNYTPFLLRSEILAGVMRRVIDISMY
jgi:hypothetical protein